MGPTVGYRYGSSQVQVCSHPGIGMEPDIGYRYGSSQVQVWSVPGTGMGHSGTGMECDRYR